VAKLATGRSRDAPFDVHAYRCVEEDRDGAVRLAMRLSGCHAAAALSRGRVVLDSRGPLVRAAVDHTYLSGPQDHEILAAGLPASTSFAARWRWPSCSASGSWDPWTAATPTRLTAGSAPATTTTGTPWVAAAWAP
jgi:hypothetical protein